MNNFLILNVEFPFFHKNLLGTDKQRFIYPKTTVVGVKKGTQLKKAPSTMGNFGI